MPIKSSDALSIQKTRMTASVSANKSITLFWRATFKHRPSCKLVSWSGSRSIVLHPSKEILIGDVARMMLEDAARGHRAGELR